MSIEHFHQFFPAVCAGFGLALVGAVNLMLLHRSVALRLLATLLSLVVCLGAAAAINVPGVVSGTLRLLVLASIPVLLLSSGRVLSAAGAILRGVHHPKIRYGLVTAGGICVAIGSTVNFEATDEAVTQEGTRELASLEGQCGSVDSKHAKAFTDLGTTIVLKEPAAIRDALAHETNEERILAGHQLKNQVMHRGPGGDQSNCHGWVFTGGTFRLGPDDVQLILTENGYEEVSEPQPGDVVVYRVNGSIAHTAIVRYVTEGQPILVEGKWGSLGVLLHAADKSVYGTEYTFHRSPRTGHLLIGVGGHAPSGDARPSMGSE